MAISWDIVILLIIFAKCNCIEDLGIAPEISPYQHEELLDPQGSYQLQWFVDIPSKTVSFNLTVKCKGFVALGLSRDGLVPGADFVVGGVNSNGRAYFEDMYGDAEGKLERDQKQNWKFLKGDKNGSWTRLSFSRKWDTEDKQDVEINDDMLYLIWAFGDTNQVVLKNPGKIQAYLLDPDFSTNAANKAFAFMVPNDFLTIQWWGAVATQRIPDEVDSQVCSFIKAPQIYNLERYIQGAGKYYAYGMDGYVRKIVLSRCKKMNGTTNSNPYYFEELVKNSTGFNCKRQFPNGQKCEERIFVLGEKGKAFYFPPEFGFKVKENDIFMLEVHYSNPKRVKNLEVKSGLAIMAHYFPERQEPGIVKIGLGIVPVPAKPNLTVSGQCTAKSKDKKEFAIYAILMIMGQLGRSMRIRHFRKNKELPLILSDGNYDTHFQQIRSLRTNVNVLEGDKLKIECSYEISRIFTVLKEEECEAYLYTNRPVSEAWCDNDLRTDDDADEDEFSTGLQDADVDERRNGAVLRNNWITS